MEMVALSDDLVTAIKKAVEKGEYKDSDQFVREAIEEKLSLMAKILAKEEVFKIAGEVRGKMEQKGVQEEEILEKFEKFRKNLNQ